MEEIKRCGCGCFLKEEETLEEYGYELYYTCNNPKCNAYGMRSR